MGLIIAVIAVIASSVGVAHKQGVFNKGYDTTYRDTVAFEKNALEMDLARVNSKPREIIALDGKSSQVTLAQAKAESRAERLTAKLNKIDELEKRHGLTD